MFFFVQLSRLLFLVLRLFVDGSLYAVKLRIYGSSVIKTIIREPRFPDKEKWCKRSQSRCRLIKLQEPSKDIVNLLLLKAEHSLYNEVKFAIL